jgi:lysozyme
MTSPVVTGLNMHYSKTALALISKFEGCELKAYQDQGGVWTIGYGHTFGVYPGMRITLQEAENLAAIDLKTAEFHVNKLVEVPLTQEEFDALTDFVFNLGCLRFATSTMLRLINARMFACAVKEFERWDRCGGKIVAGLLARRKAEEELFNNGIATAKTA